MRWSGHAYLRLHEPVTAATPHVHVRQVLGSPTTAKALTPGEGARERDHRAATNHIRDLQSYIALRASECRQEGEGPNVLVIGQKAAIDQLRDAGLPPRTEAVHFNALSGLDRWGDVACLIILGRTLPAPATVGTLTAALTGRVPLEAGGDVGGWYGTAERRIRLTRGTHAIDGEVHDDPVIAGLPLDHQPGTAWEYSRSTDVLGAVRGVVPENAADITRCFPDIWESHEAAREGSPEEWEKLLSQDLL